MEADDEKEEKPRWRTRLTIKIAGKVCSPLLEHIHMQVRCRASPVSGLPAAALMPAAASWRVLIIAASRAYCALVSVGKLLH